MLKPLVVFFLFMALPLGVFSQWQQQSSPTTFRINDILFLTENVGFLGTYNSIYKTTDAGLTWTSPQYPGGTTDQELLSSSYIFDLHFFDQSHGLMVGSGFYNGYDIIARTTDGGATWRLVYSQPVAGGVTRVPLTSIAFLDQNVGYVAGGNGLILKTSNGGDSWTPVTSPTGNTLRKVLFVNSQTGFIAGEKVLLRTIDAGATWQANAPAFDINDLHFSTLNSGIATTAEGNILNTSDGGISWTEHAINFEARLGKIAFQGETGYIIGYEGLFNRFILKTTDGGKVWEHQYPDAVNSLSGLAITPGGQAWTGGLYGKLLATTNGGGNSYPIASFNVTGTAFCEGESYAFSNNGPENKYTYEWRIDGVLKGTSYDFSTTFAQGNHTVELKAINGQLSGKSQRSVYIESLVNFSKPLELATTNGLCQGSGTMITVRDPEYGSYKLLNGSELVAEDNDYSNGILLATPALQTSTTFRVVATRSNSCKTVEIESSITLDVYSDLRLGSTLHLVQDYFCNNGVPAVEITSSRAYVRYELFSNDKLISSSVGNGQTITLQAPAIQDTTQYKVKARVVNGTCERWFDDVLEIKVEKVNAAFHLSAMNAALGEPVNVYNKSRGATNFQWTFPNASPPTSSALSPGSVTFNQAGTWQAQLRASSPSGCTDIESKSIYVYDDSFLNLSCWATGTGYGVEGNTASQEMTNVALAPNGDILTTGYYSGQAEFDSKAGPDFKTDDEVFITNFIARYSAKGVSKWVLNTSRYHVENSTNPMIGSKSVVGSDGSIYLLTSNGSFEPVFYSTDGDSIQPYKDVFIYPASQQYLIKYSEDGILQWVRSKAEITGDMLSGTFIDLEMDASDNLYVVNDTLYKLAPANGNVVSNVKVFDSPPHLQNADFSLSSDGSWYCITKSSVSATIKRYSSGGLVQWENSITSPYVAYGGSSVGPDHSLVLFGLSQLTTKFESEGESDRQLDPKSFFIVKYNPLGKIVWINTALTSGAIHGRSIAVNEVGEISLAIQGVSPSSCTLQSQDGVNFVFNAPSSPYLVKYDWNGNIITNNKIFGEDLTMNPQILLTSRQDQTYALGILSNNFSNGVNHGTPSSINGDVIYSQHQQSLFLAKFQSDCDPSPASELTGGISGIAAGSVICPGTMFNVTYEVTVGTKLEADNVFSVFLVNENGSGMVVAGSLSSTDMQGTIQARVPENIPEGNTYKIRLWASNPKLYSDIIASQFSIKSSALPDFIFSSSQDLVFRFTPSVGLDVNCKWTVEGQTIEERSPRYKFSTTGLFEVCLIAKDECNVERTLCKNVYVTCAAVPTNYTYTVNEKTVTFKGATNVANTILWEFGDGSTAATLNTEHTFTTYGTKFVCLRSSTECSQGLACKSINLPCTQGNLSFSFRSTEAAVQFANNSDADYTQFEWNFGDGKTSTDKNPLHTYPGPGTYFVTLTSSGKCSTVKTLTQSIVVQCVSPTADFQTTMNGLDVTFTNTSANTLEQQWAFGDGATSMAVSPQYHYQVAGSYVVCLTTKNNCSQQTNCRTVTISDPPPTPPTGLVATTLDRSTIALRWNDNSTTEQSFKVMYLEVGTNSFQLLATVAANVTQYTAANLLCDRLYAFQVIAVGQGTNNETGSNGANARTARLDKPIVTSSASQACQGQLIELNAPTGFISYLWSTGATGQKISITATGAYAVSVRDANGCQSVFSDNAVITFNALPDASIEVVENEIRAKALAEHYQWYLDNTPLNGSIGQEIIPEISGHYKVELTTNGCSSMSTGTPFVITGMEEQIDDQFTIYPLPAEEILFIRFDDGSYEGSSVDISLISVTGSNALHAKKSTNEKEVEIDVSKLPAGLYLCVMELGQAIVYKKIIIY